jgi:ABC-type Fe3+-hydroxamate transport system substrate-binding protein
MINRIRDDRHRELLFGQTPPTRIVSLVPSDTYSVARLGAGAALVGRTSYCELPTDEDDVTPAGRRAYDELRARWDDETRGVRVVGGTKNPDLDIIRGLEPDLILANQEENTRRDLETLAQEGFRVYVGFPRRVDEGIAHLAKIARMLGLEKDETAKALVAQGYHALTAARAVQGAGPRVRTFCPIWMQPLMTLNGETFISDMLAMAGADNVFAERTRLYPLAADLGKAKPKSDAEVGERDTRYPRVTQEELVERAPDLVLLPDEPHPFTEADAAVFAALDIPAAKNGAIRRTSGKDLCWYGARSCAALPRVRALVDSFRPGMPTA